MNILFAHRGFPSQFTALATHYGRSRTHQCTFISEAKGELPGVRRAVWSIDGNLVPRNTDPFLNEWRQHVAVGKLVANIARQLHKRGYRPDVILAHGGWGVPLFLKDVYPDVPLVTYQELFFRPEMDWGRDKDWGKLAQGASKARRIQASPFLAGLTWSDWCLSPTWWQASTIPEIYRHKVSVLHEGIDTDRITGRGQRRHDSALLPDGTLLRYGDPLVTYFARDMEPARGVHHAMPALARVLRERPDCHVLIIGGDRVNYSPPPPKGETYRERALKGLDLDPARFHYVPRLDFDQYLHMLKLSSVHLYLTTPIFLSWSMLEAMASECLVVGSATPPVQEVIEDGVNGLLVPFHDPDAIAGRILDALDNQQAYASLRQNARRTVEQHYSRHTNLALHIRLLEEIAAGQCPPPTAQVIAEKYPLRDFSADPALRPSRTG